MSSSYCKFGVKNCTGVEGIHTSSTSSAAFFVNCLNVSKSSTCTTSCFAASSSRFSAAFFCAYDESLNGPPQLIYTSCAATIFEYAAFVSLKKMLCTTGVTSSSLSVWMQLSIRSFESSSIGAEENLDWPTRIVDVIISIASARRAFAFFLSGERSANRRTSFVSAAARTVPVKKSPPRRSAKKKVTISLERESED